MSIFTGSGQLIGMLPGFYMIYLSTQDTMQIIYIEKPLGIILIVFYAVCSAFVFYSHKKQTITLSDGQME